MDSVDDLVAELAQRGYQLVRELGRGGMGVVYLARQVALDREVALKILLATTGADPAYRRRFKSEARILRNLAHPNVVRVLDVSLDLELPYICFQFIPGAITLDAVLRGGECTAARARELLLGVARGLAYIHAASIVHRDLKPANILVDATDSPRIIDLGIARRLDMNATRATQAGTIIGTLSYMAPEQMQAMEVGAPSDVYAWGLMAYELFAGRPLFTPDAGIHALDPSLRLTARLPSLTRFCPAVDMRWMVQVERCVSPDPAARPTMQEALQALDPALRDDSADLDVDTLMGAAALVAPPPPGSSVAGTGVTPPPVDSPRPASSPGEATCSIPPPGEATCSMPSPALITPVPAVASGAPRGRPAGRSLAAPGRPTDPPGSTLRTRGSARFAIGITAGTLSAVLCVFGIALSIQERRPAPPSPGPTSRPSAQKARFEATIQARDEVLLLRVKTRPAAPAELSWYERGHRNSRRLPADELHEVVLDRTFEGLEDLQVGVPGQEPVRVGLLAEPYLKQLEEMLRAVPLKEVMWKPERVAPRLSQAMERLVPLAPGWFRASGPSPLRRALLSRLYDIEVINVALGRLKRRPILPGSELLPPDWRESHASSRGPANWLTDLPGVASATPAGLPSAVDGQLRSSYSRRGTGWEQFTINVHREGGYFVSNVRDQLWGLKSEQPPQAISEFVVEVDLPPRVAAAHEVLVRTLGSGFGESVFLLDFNGRLTVPFSRPRDPAVKLVPYNAHDIQRVIPPEALVPGRNRITLRYAPDPVRMKMPPIYVSIIELVTFGPR